jgi:hypothetical protein
VADEQLSFIIADLSRFTAKETLGLALDIQANLQEDTPRDTGWARANWVMSTGAPLEDDQVARTTDPTPAQVSQAAVRQTQSLDDVLSYDLARGAIFTTNNVPYIGRLNEGHSQQAGSAFIQRSVGRALAEREGAR